MGYPRGPASVTTSAQRVYAAGISRFFDALRRYFDESADDPRFKRRGLQLTSRLIAEEGEPTADFRPVQPPDGHITDEFLENLAAAYRHAAAWGTPPALAIAEQSGAPVRTVHRWILVARKRGFLAPGIRGRAG